MTTIKNCPSFFYHETLNQLEIPLQMEDILFETKFDRNFDKSTNEILYEGIILFDSIPYLTFYSHFSRRFVPPKYG